jgi:energy-coupling factor transporter ATP-binding protein EcfA2
MKIILRNIKRITELCFEIPTQGIWILTGLNGSGKTSLFASIYRIGAKHAFQRFYKTSPLEYRVDSYEDAEIEYQIGGETVQYHYGGQRWRATPRRNANIFTHSPYASIEYIAANGDRIEPFPDEIQPRRLRNASNEIKLFLFEVLGDPKWNNLQYVNTRRGIGSDAFLVPYQAGAVRYFFSEKSFSLGELCALKLAIKISNVPNNSLLLIDEVEMALHPQAQVRLLRKVTQIATEKQLTILFSTHSATLIKNSERKQIIHLRSDSNGHVSSIMGAFPAQVLGDIAFDDELAADFVFYVEDKQAKLLTEQLIGMYIAHSYPHENYRPLYKVAPVGGFVQVVEMLNNSSVVFANYVKRYALLDEDVKTDALQNARRQGNQPLLDLFTRASNKAKFLPCTPEVGVIEMFEINTRENIQLADQLNRMFNGHNINIIALTSAPDYLQLTKANLRDRAKDRLNNIVGKIINHTGNDEIHVRRTIYNEYCKFKYTNDMGSLQRLLAPIFNAR